MRSKLLLFVVPLVAAALAALYSMTAWATPASGFRGQTLATGRFEEMNVLNASAIPEPVSLNAWESEQEKEMQRRSRVWISMQKTRGLSDLYVQTNEWDPGGSTGWHTHPGHSLILVTAGEVSVYEGNDPECKPHVYSKGMGFVDPGGEHVHLIRNEGTVPAATVAVQLIRAGAPRRIDMPDPGNCRF